MIDAYDVLNVSLDADPEDIKKAYKRLSLQHHPDKVHASGSSAQAQDANDKFHAITAAKDILQDAERRKIYDTFGVDLGEERPEMEMWTIGLSALLSPLGTFTLKTFLMRAVLWIVAFQWIRYLVLLASVVIAILYRWSFSYGNFQLRSQEGVVTTTGLAVGVVLIRWVWPLLGDAVGIFYLVSEVVDVALLLANWKVGLGVAAASFFLAWLLRNWWFWIILLEVAAAVVLLIALTVACGLQGLWIENVRQQHGEKLKEWRLAMRKQRQALRDEVEDLKRRLQAYENANGAPPGAKPGR